MKLAANTSVLTDKVDAPDLSASMSLATWDVDPEASLVLSCIVIVTSIWLEEIMDAAQLLFTLFFPPLGKLEMNAETVEYEAPAHTYVS